MRVCQWKLFFLERIIIGCTCASDVHNFHTQIFVLFLSVFQVERKLEAFANQSQW